MWPPLSVDSALLLLWSCISQELRNCWWKEQTCIVAVLGLVGWKNIIFVPDVIQSGTLLVLDFTLHTIHETMGHRRITYYWSSTEWFHMPFFTVISCEISMLIWRGILRRQCRTTGEHSSLFRSMELYSMSHAAHRTRNSDKLKCLVFCSWG